MPTIVQRKVSAAVLNSTTNSLTFDAAITPGNLAIAVTGSWRPSHNLSGVALGGGGASFTVQENVAGPTGSDLRATQSYLVVSASGATVVTATFNLNTTNSTMVIYEVSGIDAVPTVLSTRSTGTSTGPNSGSVTPTTTSMAIAACAPALSGGTVAVNDANYAQQDEVDEVNNAQTLNVAGRFSTTGAQSCTWLLSQSVAWAAHVVTYTQAPPTTQTVGFREYHKRFPKTALRGF